MTLLNHQNVFALYYLFEKVLDFFLIFKFLMSSLYFYVKFGLKNLQKIFHFQIFSRNGNCVFLFLKYFKSNSYDNFQNVFG